MTRTIKKQRHVHRYNHINLDKEKEKRERERKPERQKSFTFGASGRNGNWSKFICRGLKTTLHEHDLVRTAADR